MKRISIRTCAILFFFLPVLFWPLPVRAQIAIDAKAVKNQSSPSKTITTAAFSTKSANELLLAFISADSTTSPNTNVSNVSGAGLTWVLVQRTNIQKGTAEIWRAFATPTLTNVTVAATLSQSVDSSMTVLSFSGVNSSGTNGSGAIGSTGTFNSSAGAPTGSVVTQGNGSLVLGVGNDWDNAISRTLGSNQTLVNQYLAPVGDTYWVQMQTNPIPLSGTTVTINDTAPTTDRFNLSLVEVLAAAAGGTTGTINGSISQTGTISGATVQLLQGATLIATATVASNGSYSFTSVANGTYTLQPMESGFTFSPTTANVTVSGNTVTAPTFAATATTGTINGSISQTGTISGATVQLSQGATLIATVSVASSGSYTFSGVTNGAYTLQPVEAGFTFIPTTQNVTVNGNTVTAQTFIATATTGTINGTISQSGTISGATVQLLQGTTLIAAATVAANGSYSFASVANGTYTLQPMESGFTFNPTTANVTVSGNTVTAPTFTAVAPSGTINGTISQTGTISGATVQLLQGATLIATATVAANGSYSFASVANGTYTLQPMESGFTFSPTTANVTVTGNTVTAPTFTATSASLPDMSITKTHSGNFVQGQIGAVYTITAGNVGGAPTSGSATVTDTLPGGLTATAMSGTNWNCTLATLTCTRTDALAAGASYPPITLTVNVASNAPSSATNTATVSGGGETNTANDTASDVTSIAATNPAGIKLIQSNVNGNESTASSISAAFLSNNLPGDFLIVTGTAARPSTTITISDTLGNSYLPAIGPVTDPVQNVTAYIWYVPLCKGGTNTVTLTPATPAALEVHLSEWSGISTTSPVDQTSFATGTGTLATSGAQTSTVNGDLIFGYTFLFNTATAGTGFTPMTLVNGDLDEYMIQPVAGSVSATFTQTSGTWFALMVAFKPAGAAGPNGWSISGTVSPTAGGSGASLSLQGSSTSTTMADSLGNYIFSGLANGTYSVTPTNSGYSFTPNSQMVMVSGNNVPGVNFTAAPLPPVLNVAPNGFYFSANQNGNNPSSATANVTNTGGGSLSFTAASDSTWLNASPASGLAPQQLQLSVNISGLALGTYTGHLTVTASGVQGSPVTLTVTLNVGMATDWLMVDHDAARSGNAVDESTLNTSNVGSLQLNWSTPLDGNITAQPLYVHAIQISGQARDVVIAATGGNSIYALDASNGSVLWSRNFGAPTPNTWGLPDGFGIEAPPFIDRVAGRIYTVSTDGNFRTISLLDGTDVYPPLALIANPVTNKVWGGLNRIGSNIYVVDASNGGDVAPWRGMVYSINVSGTPTLASNFVVVPSIPAPNGGGGIWGYGGPAADLATGNLYVDTSFDSTVDSSGNEGTALYSNSMIALNSSLNLLGYFQGPAPNTIPCSGAPCDLDFASTPTVFQPAGCPTMTAGGSKNGNLYIFRTADLIARGQPLQILALNAPNDSLGSGGVGGVPAWSAANNMLYLTTAGPGVTGVAGGVVALKATSNCMFQVAWSSALGGNDAPNSTPTIANGIVFVGQGNTGAIHAYNALTGAQLWQSNSQFTGAGTFAAPTVAGGKLYVGSWASLANGGGLIATFALPVTGPVLSVSPQTVSFSATSGGSNPQPATANITNLGTGTLTFTASSDSGWLTVVPTSGTAPQSLQLSALIAGLSQGTYTGHITLVATGAQNSPSVITVTLTVGSAPPPGLAIDAKVSKDNGSASTTIVSPPISTAAGNELLLALIATDYVGGANTTVSSVTGGGLTWTLVVRSNGQSGTSEIWSAFAASSLSNATVTATLSQSVASSMTLISFTGVNTSGTNGSGAIGAIKSMSASSGAPAATLVTTHNNSWIFGVGNDYDNAIARVPGTGQSLVHQYLAPVGDTYWVQMQNAPTPISGTSITINDTAPAGDRYNLAICEILPAP